MDTRTSQVAIYGRVADEFTRGDLNPRQFSARLLANARRAVRKAIQKEDGVFAFPDLPASPPDYDLELAGRQYQTRRLTVSAPGGSAALEIAPDGEDELHVIVTSITGARAEFAMLPFLPPIADDAPVLGSSGFATTLGEALEGVDVDGAELLSVAGLAVDRPLRIRRSRRLLLRPGPYYPFPESTTVLAVRVVETTAGAAPIADAQFEITAVNGAAVTSVVVDGVTLFRAALATAGGGTLPFMIGTREALVTRTDSRGLAVFYYAPTTPVTSLTLSVSRPRYVTRAVTATVQPRERSSSVIQLARS